MLPKPPRAHLLRDIQLPAAGLELAILVATAIDHATPIKMVVILGCCIGSMFMMLLPPLTAEGALDRGEVGAMITARGLCGMGLVSSIIGGTGVRVIAGGMFAYAFALVVWVLVRDRALSRFLVSVYGGDHSDLRIVRDDEVRGFELLPPVLSGTITDAVIAEVSAKHDYRTSHGPRALARVTRSLVKMDARLEKRRRGALFLGAAMMVSVFLSFAFAFRPTAPARAQTKPSVSAPACRDAVPYFEERLESLRGVGRATVIVHGATGEVVYVPKAGSHASPELDAIVLEAARSIPCSDKLALSIAQPRFVAFDVSAELTIDDGASAAAVQRDAEEQVRALFQPDAHALDTEHFGFGATEKTFGYRVRHALRHVSGVKAVKLVVDGSDHDASLEPTDYPALKTLSIGVVH